MSQRNRIKYGQIVATFVRQGWRPPRMSDRTLHRLLDDIEKAELHGATLELSPRERQCLQFAALGMTKQEIADDLGISIETVKTIIKKTLARLGAKNVAHAVAIGIRNGVIQADDESDDVREAA